MENRKHTQEYSLSSLGIKLSVDQDELVTNFFSSYYDKELDLNSAMALDLYRAINCYRYYHDVDLFVEINPEAADHRDDIESLWEEFDKLSSSELAEIALKALEEV